MESVNETTLLNNAKDGNEHAFASLIEPYRHELQVHCYRLLGSLQDAEDIVQETWLRAWRRLGTFEGRSSFRAWLYKIATNATLDLLRSRPRRQIHHAHFPPSDPADPFAPPLEEPIWLDPLPDQWLSATPQNPETRYTVQESVSLGFLSLLQHLPASQRAVLILRDVLEWRADEVAELLDMSLSAVNSALFRARTKLRTLQNTEPISFSETLLDSRLDSFIQLWESADVQGLVSLLREDVIAYMPPSPSWYLGKVDVGVFLARHVFVTGVSWRAIPTNANAIPAFALYVQNPISGEWMGQGILVLMVEGEWIVQMVLFMNPALLRHFGDNGNVVD